MPPALAKDLTEQAAVRTPSSDATPALPLPDDDSLRPRDSVNRHLTEAQIGFLGTAEELFLQMTADDVSMDPETFKSYYLYVMHHFEYQGRRFKPALWLLHCMGVFSELFEHLNYRRITWFEVSRILRVVVINSHLFERMLEETAHS